MPILVAAVVLLFFLAFLCLLLLLGLTRRLRSLTDRLVDLEQKRLALNALPAGTTIDQFEVSSFDGERLTDAWLAGEETIVAFVAYGCPSCKSQLPALRAQAESGERVLAVVARVPGETPDLTGMRETLGDAVVLAEEEFGGSAQTAFQIDSFPTFFLIDSASTPVTMSAGVRDLVRARQLQRATAGAH